MEKNKYKLENKIEYIESPKDTRTLEEKKADWGQIGMTNPDAPNKIEDYKPFKPDRPKRKL